MLLGFGYIPASWIWIYPRDLDLDLSTRFWFEFVHATWTWICPHDLDMDLSTRLGLGFVDATWTWICPCEILAAPALLHSSVDATWICRRDLDLHLSTQNFSRSCSPQLLLDLDYFCLVHPMFLCVVTLRPTTSRSTSWPSTCTLHPSASVVTMPTGSSLLFASCTVYLAVHFFPGFIFVSLFRPLIPDSPCNGRRRYEKVSTRKNHSEKKAGIDLFLI